MNLVDLQSFLKVADGGSLAHAARVLDVPRSTISRRVARLEEALMRGSTRSLAVEVLQHARGVGDGAPVVEGRKKREL